MIKILDLIPFRLFSEKTNSNIYKFFGTIDTEVNALNDSVATIARNYIIGTMEDGEGLDYWESVLRLPKDSSLSIGDRRARIFSYLSGTEGTALDIKQLIATGFGLSVDDIDIIPRKDRGGSNVVTNYTYDIRIDPAIGSFNIESLRESIERIHPLHCRLGGLLQYIDFWYWEDSVRRLGLPEYHTGWSQLSHNGRNLESTLLVSANEQSNEEKFALTYASERISWYLACTAQESPDLTVKIWGGYTGIDDKIFTVDDQNSPTFTPSAGDHMLYMYVDSNDALAFGIATSGFTANDPETYSNLSSPDSTDVYPLCLVNFSTGTETSISDTMIKNIQQK